MSECGLLKKAKLLVSEFTILKSNLEKTEPETRFRADLDVARDGTNHF